MAASTPHNFPLNLYPLQFSLESVLGDPTWGAGMFIMPSELDGRLEMLEKGTTDTERYLLL